MYMAQASCIQVSTGRAGWRGGHTHAQIEGAGYGIVCCALAAVDAGVW